MKRMLLVLVAVLAATLTIGCGGVASAEFTGHIVDAQCANPDAEVNAECAKDCIKGGSPAVLLTHDGKIYQISNQDEVTEHAGHKVTITGSESGGTITADAVRMGG